MLSPSLSFLERRKRLVISLGLVGGFSQGLRLAKTWDLAIVVWAERSLVGTVDLSRGLWRD